MHSDAQIEQVARFRAALRIFLRRTEQVTAAAGLTPQRYDLLLFIHAAPGRRATTTDLLEQLQLGQPAVTELVNNACDAGLVRRSPDDEDRRRVWLELTPEGVKRVHEAVAGLARGREELAATLASTE
jgi:DNA-binding MarR family transcriptional regulator